MKLKGRITVPAFVDILATIPAIKVAPQPGQKQIINAYEERTYPFTEFLELGVDFEYRYRVLLTAKLR